MFFSNLAPSYFQGFARSPGESVLPHLWHGLEGVFCPFLGHSGDNLFDIRKKNNGTLIGKPSWRLDEFGYTLDMGGTTNVYYVNIPQNSQINLDGKDELTIGALIYPDSAGQNGNGRILDHKGGSSGGKGYTFAISSDGSYQLAINATLSNWSMKSGTSAVNLDSWQYAIGTWKKGVTADFYRDGVSVGGTQTVMGSAISGETGIGIRIGVRFDDAREWDGYIGEVHIYSRYFTASQAMDLYLHRRRMFELRRPIFKAPAAVGGRIMSSLVGAGGLAGEGGIAGQGGGLAA